MTWKLLIVASVLSTVAACSGGPYDENPAYYNGPYYGNPGYVGGVFFLGGGEEGRGSRGGGEGGHNGWGHR
jgi:hypothetical protein